MRKIKTAIQKGFTLIELVIVVLVLGVLISVVAAQFNGGITDSARAMAIYDASSKLATNWQILNQNCGTPTTVANNPLYNNGAQALDLLVIGAQNGNTQLVQQKYQGCYNTAGIRPLSDVIQGSVGGPYTVQNTYTVTMAGGGGTTAANSLIVAFDGVSTEAVTALILKYGNPSDLQADGTLATSKSNATGNSFQYTAENGPTGPTNNGQANTGNLRTVRILRPI